MEKTEVGNKREWASGLGGWREKRRNVGRMEKIAKEYR